MAAKSTDTAPTPEAMLQSFLARYDAGTQKLVKALRVAFRKRFPTACELGYDYGRQVVISYGPNERGIDAIVSLGIRESGVQLFLNNGPRLPDPEKLLKGKAGMTRYIDIDSASRLEDPAVDALIKAATKLARVPLPKTGKGTLSIRGKAAR